MTPECAAAHSGVILLAGCSIGLRAEWFEQGISVSTYFAAISTEQANRHPSCLTLDTRLQPAANRFDKWRCGGSLPRE
jgi:hypothetical protein